MLGVGEIPTALIHGRFVDFFISVHIIITLDSLQFCLLTEADLTVLIHGELDLAGGLRGLRPLGAATSAVHRSVFCPTRNLLVELYCQLTLL